MDSETSIIVAGQTGSGDFPVAGSLHGTDLPSILTSFVTKIAPSFTLGVGYGFQGQLAFTADPWRVSSYVSSTAFGNATDLPIVGDWDGSGVKRIGIFRNGTWILDTNGNGVMDGSDKTVVFGQTGDIPIVGDWRGTGRIALGLFRQGTFILDLSGHLTGIPTGQSDATFAFGQGGDIPIVADWNGSGTRRWESFATASGSSTTTATGFSTGLTEVMFTDRPAIFQSLATGTAPVIRQKSASTGPDSGYSTMMAITYGPCRI